MHKDKINIIVLTPKKNCLNQLNIQHQRLDHFYTLVASQSDELFDVY